MIIHCFVHVDIIQTLLIPLSKCAQVDLSSPDQMYRSVAISSLLSQSFDNLIIKLQQDLQSTLNCFNF